MPLYTCPGCKKPIAESQPLEHCLQCDAMNERQRARNRARAASVSAGTTTTTADTVVECTIITIILRRPSQQYGNGSAPQPPRASSSGSPPSYEDVFQWDEPETTVTDNNRPPQQATNVTVPQRGATVTIPIHTRRS